MLLGPLALAESSVEALVLRSRIENVAQAGVRAVYCDEEHIDFYRQQCVSGGVTVQKCDVWD